MIFKTTAEQLDDLSSLDETLVKYTRLGSDAAFGILVGRHGDAVYTIVRNMSAAASEAEELTLQTFIYACREMRSVGLAGSFRTRLYGIAIKTALASRRRQHSATSTETAPARRDSGLRRMPIAGDWRDLTDLALDDGNLVTLLRDALERMDDGVRAAFVLCDLAELPAHETASVLETHAEEVRHRVHRARLMLINVLDSYFGGLA